MDNGLRIKYDLFGNLTQDQKNKNLCWWLNERNYSDMNPKLIEEKINGLLEAGAQKPLTFSFNPISKKEKIQPNNLVETKLKPINSAISL